MDTRLGSYSCVLSLALLCVATPAATHAQRDSAGIAVIGRMSAGLPLGVSASVAAVREHRPRNWGQAEGPFVGVELGALGAAMSVGRFTALDGGGDLIQASVLQWWGRGQNTYVGGERRFMAFIASVGVGLYARVVGTHGPAWLPVLTFGIGY